MSTYQLLPPLSEDEYAALVADIEANGIMVPIIEDQHGTVIDGHHRKRIAEQLGISCPKVAREFSSDDERYEFALRAEPEAPPPEPGADAATHRSRMRTHPRCE
jgi:ParB-like chromosome segregation protein Spo0J